MAPWRRANTGSVMVQRRKKGFTAAQSKSTSRRMKTATVGTHMPTRVRSSRMNGDAVGFSSPRKQKRASRGYVDTILPSTSSRESSSEFSRRVSRREFTQEIQRRARVRSIIIAVVCIVAAVCIAGGVGVATFFGSLDGKLALANSDASTALVAAKEGKAFYTLVSADLDPAGSANAVDGPDALALVRVDEATRAVTVVSIPVNLQTSLKDGKTHQLREATTLEGDASLISAVASFAGVDVSHFVKIDAEGLVQLVDKLGGLQVQVAEEVDDPTAGDLYIPAGEQTLDGQAILTLVRASNFADGLEVQTANQREVLTALSLRLLSENALGFLTTLDTVGGTFGTDMGAQAASSLADALRGMDASSVYGALVPGYETTRDNVTYYVSSSSAWTAMMDLVKEGQDPVVEETVAGVDPGSFTVTVRNGSAITGAASQIAESLKGLGFDVVDTGNADSAVYDDTLVVYNDNAFEPAAQTVVSALGMGRTVAGSGFYTFDTDVLVILGKDWKPTA